MADPTSANPAIGTKLACVELADIIERIESSHFLAALRFEPGTHKARNFLPEQIQRCREYNNCNIATARVLLSMSFGLYQIMGFNLYHAGTCDYDGSIGELLVSRDIQRKMLNAFLRANHIAYTARDMLDKTKRDHFARKYNGPGNVPNYSAKILAAANALGVV